MRIVVAATAFLASGFGVADAHIHLTSPKSRIDTEAGIDQKDEPCGVTGQVRQPDRVTTFKPGQKITVTWKETVDHTSHFRIAFQPNGDKFGIPPAKVGGGFPDVNQTGTTDATGALILKDMIDDNNTSTTATLSHEVTLPNIECNNCTLQFIQVMTDNPPYTTDDIYFNCADLILSNSATPPPDPPPSNPPDAGTPDGGGGSAMNSGELSGGCTAAGGSLGWLAVLVLGFVTRGRRARE